MFQSTPPRGKRHFGDRGYLLGVDVQFQSTPPRGKRPGAGAFETLAGEVFQSTPPRGKRPAQPLVLIRVLQRLVSIHAPAREATSVMPHAFSAP